MVIEFVGLDLVNALASLHYVEYNIQHTMTGGGIEAELPPDLVERTLNSLKRLTMECADNMFTVSAAVGQQAVQLLTLSDLGKHAAYVLGQITALRKAVMTELASQKFAHVPPSKTQWFGQNQLFGERVADVFPLAADDIREAGNCLALGLDTAAVFHLMRVAEHGLRKMAKSVGIKNIGKKNTPVEYSTWNTVVENIEKKLTTLHGLTPSKTRARKLTHYADMNAHVLAFKDAWRDDIMHSRKQYNELESAAVFVHVRGFMQRLATGPT